MGMLLKLLICIGAIYFSFKINIYLGIFFIVISLLYLYILSYSNFMVNRANAEYSAKNHDKALAYYKKALNFGRPSMVTHTGYALMLLRCGKPDEALERINMVLSSINLPQNIKQQAKQIRILINYNLNNADEAYEEAIELYEDGYQTSTMRSLVGLLMIATNQPSEKTLNFCEEAYDYDSENRDILDNYLIVLTNENQFELAKEISDDLISLAPKFIEAYYHSALLYKKLGDNKRAKDLLKEIPGCDRTFMTTVSEEEIENLKSTL